MTTPSAPTPEGQNSYQRFQNPSGSQPSSGPQQPSTPQQQSTPEQSGYSQPYGSAPYASQPGNDSPYGHPQQGQPQYDQSQYGQGQYGQGQYGQAQQGQPQYGQEQYQQQNPYATAQYGTGGPYGAPGQYDPTGRSTQTEPRKTNILAFVALGVAVIGAVLVCIPSISWIGWIVLGLALVASIVSILLPQMKRMFGFIAAGVSVMGMVAGLIVFLIVSSFGVVNGGPDEAGPSESETVATDDAEPSESVPEETEPEDDVQTNPGGDVGTMENPYAMGDLIEGSTFTFQLNSVELDANDAVQSENPINEAPESGAVWIMANFTLGYTGSDPDANAWLDITYIDVDGNEISWTEFIVVTPDKFDWFAPMEDGDSVTGNETFQVPADTAEQGVFQLRFADEFSDPVYVSLQ